MEFALIVLIASFAFMALIVVVNVVDNVAAAFALWITSVAGHVALLYILISLAKALGAGNS